MAIITISIVESKTQLVSGIPEWVEFDSNIPATIFYTIDGSDPTEESEIAIGKIYLPRDKTSLTVKAFAMSGDDTSSILDEEYSIPETEFNRGRTDDDTGIVVLTEGDITNNSLGFDSSGNEVKQFNDDLEDLDLIASTTDRQGQKTNKTSLDFVNLQTGHNFTKEIRYANFADPANFNPRAQIIILDSSTPDKFAEQYTRPLLRQFNNLQSISNPFNQRIKDHVLAGNFVKYMINSNTGKIVFYYFDSIDNRWIKSISEINGGVLNIGNILTNKGSGRFVFRWIEERTITRIF